MELINALAPVGDSLWVAVVILGEWRSIIAAYKAVSDIVHGGKLVSVSNPQFIILN